MRISALFSFVCIRLSLVAATLVPGVQIPITTDNALRSPVSVGGNSTGFMAVWQDTGDNIQSSFFPTDGSSWNTPVEINGNASYLANVAGNSTGFVATWLNVAPGGFPEGNVYSAFSNDSGGTWSVNQISAAGGSAFYPVNVAANDAGFMAVWVEYDFEVGDNVWVSYSTDGTTWGSPVEVYSGGDVAAGALCGIAATSDGFMVSWVNSTTNAPYSSFSNDNGEMWSAPSNITMSFFTDAYGALLAGTDSGFMAVWQDDSNAVQSSFSTDHGSTWGAPVTVSTAAPLGDIILSASSGGFVVGWHNPDNNAEGAISTDLGGSWSTALITNDGSVGSVYDSFVSVNAAETGAMFTWTDAMANGQSNFATFGSAAPNSPTGLSGSQEKNSFGTLYEAYNALEWTLSSSDDVAAYYVFRNGAQIATLGSTATSYQDHNQKRGFSVTYSVTAVDGNGNQSSAVSVIVK